MIRVEIKPDHARGQHGLVQSITVSLVEPVVRDFKDRMKWYAASAALNGMAWFALKLCDSVPCEDGDEVWEDE